MTLTFQKSFTQQEPLPEAAIEQAVEIMRSGRLHRYNTAPGETSEASELEREFAALMKVRFCLACASGGYAMHIAMKACGVKPGDLVITNAFTLAPVPGAIHNAGAKAVLVDIDDNYRVDLEHLEQTIKNTNSGYFLLSHMRGHIADMHAIKKLCDDHNVCLIEDCAHTMGAAWDGQASGTFGTVACFSTQTYKHINSGEGGLLTTNDDKIMARAIIHSGSYMLYERHGTPPDASVFENIRLETPNYSGRMDNLRASLLRNQLKTLDINCERWNQLYQVAQNSLSEHNTITQPQRPEKEQFVASSIQFRAETVTDANDFLDRCMQRGVELKWFGSDQPSGFTSRYDSWQYIEDIPHLPNTLKILKSTFDMRLPLTFDTDDIETICTIIKEEVQASS